MDMLLYLWVRLRPVRTDHGVRGFKKSTRILLTFTAGDMKYATTITKKGPL